MLTVFGLLTLIFVGFEFNRTGDFSFYYLASERVFDSGNIYQELFGDKSNLNYFGSPVLTLLFQALSWLPISIAAGLWKVLSLIMLWRTWEIMQKFFNLKFENIKHKNRFELMAFAAIAFLLYTNFHLLQLTVFLLFASLEGLYQIQVKKRPWLGALLISTAIYTKVSPIVLLPYLVYRKEWKATVFTFAFMAALAILPTLVLGWEKSIELWQSWFASINPTDTEAAFDMNNNKNQGISSWISSLFIAEIRHSESSVFIKRYITDLKPNTVFYMIQGTRLALVAFTLYFLKFPPFTKVKNTGLHFREISYLLLVIPLIFPQQRSYNFLFLWPTITYLIYGLQTNAFELKSGKKWIMAVLILALIILNLELLLGAYRKYYWHFKTLTYATFILLGLLAFLKPKSEAQMPSKSI